MDKQPETVMEAIDQRAKRLAEKGRNSDDRLRNALWEAAGTFPDELRNPEVYQHIEHLANEIMQQEMEENPVIHNAATIDGVKVKVVGIKDMTEKEARNYITVTRMQKCNTESKLMTLTLRNASDNSGNVAIDYAIRTRPMERIRRITGYLVGTVDRWNNAKQAELHDRVKHTHFSR